MIAIDKMTSANGTLALKCALGTLIHRLRKAGNSLGEGVCEVCDALASNLYVQGQYRYLGDGHATIERCQLLFGHRQCLSSARK